MDDIPSALDSLEEDDLIYLDYYLNEKCSVSPNFQDFPSVWSPSSEEMVDGSLEPIIEGEVLDSSSLIEESTNISSVQLQCPVNNEVLTNDVRQIRKSRGVPKERFVSYESFPPVRGRSYACEICGMKLATKESNKRHVLTQHIKERRHVCDICGKAFIFKFALKAHSAIHSDTPKFICVCGMNFKVKSSYMNHIQRIHRAASETKFTCELCFKIFEDRHTLRIHIISVHKPKTISCIQKGCNKVFSSISLMRCHYRYHLNQKFTCDKCGRSFSTESYMQKHLLTHSGVRPYTCLDCGKTYLSASHRNQHRRLCHSSTKMYQCSFCGKFFKFKDQLQYHESNHRGEKPFKCEVCGYATAYKSTYYAHRKKHLTTAGSSEAVQKESTSSASNSKATSKRNDSVAAKSKHRKVPHPIRPKPNINKVNGTTQYAVKRIGQSSICRSSVNNVSPSSSLSLSSTSTPLLTDDSNVNFIIFPPSVISCSENPADESILNGDVQLSVKCVGSDINLVACSKDSIDFIEHNIKDDTELVVQESLDKQMTEETEKNDTYVILSNNGKCSISECDSMDDSLLLVKIGDNSFAGVCTNHTVSDEMEISDLKLTSVENLTLTTIDSQSLGADCTAGVNAVSIQLVEDIKSMESQQAVTSDHREAFMSPCKSNENLLDINSIDQSSAMLMANDQNRIMADISLPLTQSEGLKSNLCSSEDLAPDTEMDPGISSLSGHIVDDSLHLAQLEVVCPVCDEQFFCMNTYITHLENFHS